MVSIPEALMAKFFHVIGFCNDKQWANLDAVALIILV